MSDTFSDYRVSDHASGEPRRYLPIDWDTPAATVARCRADALCRCRKCKPPLSEVRALQRLRVGVIIAAILVAVLFGLRL